MTDEAVVTAAELAAAEERIAARKVLVDAMNRLIEDRDRAKQDATIDLTVAVDVECAGGLRRKTRHGHGLSPSPPREALRKIDKALSAWPSRRSRRRPGPQVAGRVSCGPPRPRGRGASRSW